ncbi:B12-binding domain-containing radical SAM protein [Marinoscillum sp.]|uniref:B12-binding domain-containing radical SAM protein n=1 Tax=Marinoscillum sp. TaxID=2024838 RepID=UPI003BABD34F
MNKVILFNPFSARNGYRIPNSILQVAASIHDRYDVAFVDGNRERDPWQTIQKLLDSGEYLFFGCTVMPGPQLRQAIPFTKRIRQEYPDVKIIWGGYFPSNQYQVVLESGYVDFVINGQGDHCFPQLLDGLSAGQTDFDHISNLIYRKGQEIVKTKKEFVADQDNLPKLPYTKIDLYYSLKGYLKKTFLGQRTAAYHASFGCPFTCSFCAVVPIYNARWKSKSASNIYADIKYLIENHGADAVEFHDNNFFVNEKMVVEFSQLIKKHEIQWWGEGRIDTLSKYKDESLRLMAEAGCKMIFFGAESSNDDILSQMDKGGTQTAEQILDFAGRMHEFGIIPEYSFVLGMPLPTESEVNAQLDQDIAFIKKVKRINPETEIIIYLYSPVPTENSELYSRVKETGFRFPSHLEDWLDPQWENFDLRRNPLTPWLKPYMVDKIRDFETVLNAQYPTASDFKLTRTQRRMMKLISHWRYRLGWYKFPYELKALQKFWLRYRRPETEGFAMKES